MSPAGTTSKMEHFAFTSSTQVIVKSIFCLQSIAFLFSAIFLLTSKCYAECRRCWFACKKKKRSFWVTFRITELFLIEDSKALRVKASFSFIICSVAKEAERMCSAVSMGAAFLTLLFQFSSFPNLPPPTQSLNIGDFCTPLHLCHLLSI